MQVVNSVRVTGEVITKPELTFSKAGHAVLKFGMVQRTEKDGRERENYIKCIAFGKTAEDAQIRLQQGSNILVEGKLTGNLWNAPDGTTRIFMEVLLLRLTVYNQEPVQQSFDQQEEPQRRQDDPIMTEEDVPF